MKNVDIDKTLDSTNAFFDDYFEKMDLNEDLKKIYEIINDEDAKDELEKNSFLTKLRNENHKSYYDIDINKLNNLPTVFNEIVTDILSLYNQIESSTLLNENRDLATKHKHLLNDIVRKTNRLDQMIKTTLKELTKKNDLSQSKLSVAYFNSLDVTDNIKKQLLDKYNDLVLYNVTITEDIYEDIKRQTTRNEYIKEIMDLLNTEETKKIDVIKKDKLTILNDKIDKEINKYKDKIHYLGDLMIENSQYKEEFNDFVEFCNKLMTYDENNYENAKQTFEVLCDDTRFKILISHFEEEFIQERENNKKEETFVYEKFGIKNIKKSLDYISANYMDNLNLENKQIIKYVYDKIETNNYDLDEMNKTLNLIVRNIWETTITDVYAYNPSEDFYFICSNNQFIDEKYQTILITKKELERVEDYLDFQIGFICSYNNNIMYITENEDIMTVNHDDMSNLKTPLQLEQEFINFRVCNRIALNGYKTKVEAVYFIDDGNNDKYVKAVELSNQNNLPLIVLKKR